MTTIYEDYGNIATRIEVIDKYVTVTRLYLLTGDVMTMPIPKTISKAVAEAIIQAGNQIDKSG